jgi:hypothetical protein
VWQVQKEKAGRRLEDVLIFMYFFHARAHKDNIKRVWQEIRLVKHGGREKEFGVRDIAKLYLSRKIKNLWEEDSTTIEDVYAREKEYGIIDEYMYVSNREKGEIGKKGLCKKLY